jgi:branched-chain amino acid transport system substrate-binding protein
MAAVAPVGSGGVVDQAENGEAQNNCPGPAEPPSSRITAGPRIVLAGVSVSITGEFRRQGQDALNAIRLWAEHVERAGGIAVGDGGPRQPVRLILLDDGSRTERAKDNILRLLRDDRVDLVLGPYSSKLTLAAAAITEASGKILWNHGGSSDVIWSTGSRRVISVPSPASDYLRELPGLAKLRDPRVRRISMLYASRGSFAAHVAKGAAQGAKAVGFDTIELVPFEPPLGDARAILEQALEARPDVLISVGSFEDDLSIVRHRRLLEGVSTLAVVAAGLDGFHREVGELAEGVIGPSQWEAAVAEAPETGPDSRWFCSEFEQSFGQSPGYPAAQAYAAGVIIEECVKRARSLDDDTLLQVARGFRTTTLYGPFRLDPLSLRQTGHRVHLVEWRQGRKELVTP